MQCKKLYYLIKQFVILSLGIAFVSPVAHAEMLWSPKPLIEKSTPPSGHEGHTTHQNQHGRSREKAFYLQDGINASVSYITPKLTSSSLTSQDKNYKYVLPNSGMDNYHALIAERQMDKSHESSIRYPYMRGKPSGESPETLITHNKLPLEIIPEPMIREHWRFYSNNTHLFQVLFNNKPLADSWVILNTSNDSTIELMTDKEGRVSFTLPDDFKNIKPGRRANKPAEFLLRTAHVDNNMTYKTNFTAPYSVNPSHWKSGIGGIATLSIGFISGIFIMRRHNSKYNKRSNQNKAAKKASRSTK